MPKKIDANHVAIVQRMSELKRQAAIQNLVKAAEANRIRYAARQKSYFNCRTCGIAVVCKPSHLKKKSYCSKVCMAEGYREQLRGSANPNFREGGIRLCVGWVPNIAIAPIAENCSHNSMSRQGEQRRTLG